MTLSKKIFQTFILSFFNPVILIQLLAYLIDGKFLIYRDRISNFSDLNTSDVLIIFILPQLIFFISSLFLSKKGAKTNSLLKIYSFSAVVLFFIYGISFAICHNWYMKNRIENPIEISNTEFALLVVTV